VSDLFAVLVVGDTALHCVDFDRPYWYRPRDFGAGVVPHPEHFVVDALLAMASDQVLPPERATEAAALSEKIGRKLDTSASAAWNALRSEVYRAHKPGVLYVAIPAPEALIEQDLMRLTMPIVRSRTEGLAEELRP
jgi:hypothetical protein